MSALMLSELSPSDRAAVERACAGMQRRSYDELVALLTPPAKTPHPLAVYAPRSAGGVNPLPDMEPAA